MHLYLMQLSYEIQQKPIKNIRERFGHFCLVEVFFPIILRRVTVVIRIVINPVSRMKGLKTE